MKLRLLMCAVSTIAFANTYTISQALADGYEIIDIGTLGGPSAVANDINDVGDVTGSSLALVHVRGETIYRSHVFLYDGTMLDLVTGDDDYDTYSGEGINDSGHVVGNSQFTGGEDTDYAAFLYDGNSILDLCALTECIEHGWDYLESANGINDQGDITGYGYIDGVRRAFLIIADDDDPPIETEICDDGIDNDGDGRTDCKDKDCRIDPICEVTGGGKK